MRKTDDSSNCSPIEQNPLDNLCVITTCKPAVMLMKSLSSTIKLRHVFNSCHSPMFFIWGASLTRFPRLARHFDPVSNYARKASNSFMFDVEIVHLMLIIIFLKEFTALICTFHTTGGNFSVNFPPLKFSHNLHRENTGKTENENSWFSNKESEDRSAVDFVLPGFGESEAYFTLGIVHL